MHYTSNISRATRTSGARMLRRIAGLALLAISLSGGLLAQEPGRKLYMDVHRLGPGNVTAEAVAEAHKKDLAVQDLFYVEYKRYWVDENEGTVYCLVEAPSPEAAEEVHRRAHGLVADEIVEMNTGILPASPTGERKLFMDTHEAGPGMIDPDELAQAHRKDLEVQDEFATRFLEYWYDETSGKVHCLAEAPSADSVRATHQKAHGMLPTEIEEVLPGQ